MGDMFFVYENGDFRKGIAIQTKMKPSSYTGDSSKKKKNIYIPYDQLSEKRFDEQKVIHYRERGRMAIAS